MWRALHAATSMLSTPTPMLLTMCSLGERRSSSSSTRSVISVSSPSTSATAAKRASREGGRGSLQKANSVAPPSERCRSPGRRRVTNTLGLGMTSGPRNLQCLKLGFARECDRLETWRMKIGYRSDPIFYRLERHVEEALRLCPSSCARYVQDHAL